MLSSHFGKRPDELLAADPVILVHIQRLSEKCGGGVNAPTNRVNIRIRISPYRY